MAHEVSQEELHNGPPLAERGPLQRRRFVPKDELIKAIEQMNYLDSQQFRADLDATVDQDLDA